MMFPPVGESRERREELTKRALADVIRKRMAVRRLRQSDVIRESGISRTHIQSLLQATKCPSLFLFLELGRALETDPRELVQAVLEARDSLCAG